MTAGAAGVAAAASVEAASAAGAAAGSPEMTLVRAAGTWALAEASVAAARAATAAAAAAAAIISYQDLSRGSKEKIGFTCLCDGSLLGLGSGGSLGGRSLNSGRSLDSRCSLDGCLSDGCSCSGGDGSSLDVLRDYSSSALAPQSITARVKTHQ